LFFHISVLYTTLEIAAHYFCAMRW